MSLAGPGLEPDFGRLRRRSDTSNGKLQIPCVVAGAGGYTRLGKLQKINGAYPNVPFSVANDLTLEKYDHANFGFLRIEVSRGQIIGVYSSAPYTPGASPTATEIDNFTVDLAKKHTVRSNARQAAGRAGRR